MFYNCLFKNKKNYVLITDIGKDCDDTLALLVLLHHHVLKKINLVAIVVSGSNLYERVKIVLYWLMKYKIKNIAVIKSRDLNMKYETKCDTQNCDNVSYATLEDYNNTIVKKSLYSILTGKKPITIICTSVLTPLADIIIYHPYDKYNIEHIYLQGSMTYINDILYPNFSECNFIIDKKSTNIVLKLFRNIIPITFLGNDTASLIHITKNHLHSLDVIGCLNLTPQAEDNLINISKDRILFKKLFSNNFPKTFDIDDDKFFQKDNKFLKYINKYIDCNGLLVTYIALYPETCTRGEILKINDNVIHRMYNRKDETIFKKSTYEVANDLFNIVLTSIHTVQYNISQ
jgi:inosine-uridine nucleoside N-ribohydrolase